MKKIGVSVRDKELSRLTAGSFEHLISSVESALIDESLRLFGKKIAPRIVGTFPGYVVVMVENDQLRRVKYEDSKGKIRILVCENFEVKSRASNGSAYLKEEAAKAVDALERGDATCASDILKNLIPLVPRRMDHETEERVLDAILAFHAADRPWKQVFKEKASEVKRLVLDEISRITQDQLPAKFRSLYNGTVTDSDSYRDLVIDNLKNIEHRTDQLIGQVDKASRTADSLLTDSNNTRALVSFSNFAQDLGADLHRIKRAINESVVRLARVDLLGKLYDSLVADFKDREIASCFVSKTLTRLQDLQGSTT